MLKWWNTLDFCFSIWRLKFSGCSYKVRYEIYEKQEISFTFPDPQRPPSQLVSLKALTWSRLPKLSPSRLSRSRSKVVRRGTCPGQVLHLMKVAVTSLDLLSKLSRSRWPASFLDVKMKCFHVEKFAKDLRFYQCDPLSRFHTDWGFLIYPVQQVFIE